MTRMSLLVGVALMLFSFTTVMGANVAPALMNYQGLLLDSNGDPVSDCVTLTFKIYDAETAGAIVWQETHSNICPDEGKFSVLLGAGDTPQPLTDAVFQSSGRWLGVQVGADPELTPRTRLVSVGYSQRVNTVDLAKGGVLTGDLALEAEDGDGTDVVTMTASGNQGAVYVTSTDVAKAVTRTVEIVPADGIALRATEQNGDETVLITSNPQGGTVLVTGTDVAKAVTGTVLIQPENSIALQAKDGNGNIQLEAVTDPSGSSVIIYEVGKDGKATSKKLELTKDALFFYDASGANEMFRVDANGNVFSRGNFVAGQPLTKDQRDYPLWATLFGYNNSCGDSATVSGGYSNTAAGEASTISGGTLNQTEGYHATVSGGFDNTADQQGTVGGGGANVAGNLATVAGGWYNLAEGAYSTIGGGQWNRASDWGATVGGGWYNNARGYLSVVAGGGGSYEADSNTALGWYSVIPGGQRNYTSGDYAFAAGRRARAVHAGSLVWADHEDSDFSSERADQFRIRTDGGFRMDDGTSWVDMRDDGTYLIQTSTGANLTLAGVWANTSDRNSKENFQPIDKQALLEKLAQLEITEWNYKVEKDDVHHIGPMAQDFYRIFGVGTDDKTISSLDPAGVALAAIQALDEKTSELERKSDEIEQMKVQMAELQALVNKLLADRE